SPEQGSPVLQITPFFVFVAEPLGGPVGGTCAAPCRSRTFGEADLSLGHIGAVASGRRQARDDFRFPFYHLGIRPCIPLGDHLLEYLDRPLKLLIRQVLDRIAVLELMFSGHQQDKQFQKYRRLVPHHLLYRLAAAATEGGVHFPDGVGVQRMTRASARPDRGSGTWSEDPLRVGEESSPRDPSAAAGVDGWVHFRQRPGTGPELQLALHLSHVPFHLEASEPFDIAWEIDARSHTLLLIGR